MASDKHCMDGINFDYIPPVNSNELIFVMTFNGKLPSGYAKVAKRFTEYGISLVPIEFDQYLEFFRSFNHIHLLIIEGGINQKQWFKRCFQGHFEFAIKSKVLTLHHISSFSAASFKKGYERFANYSYYKLPVKTHDLVDDIAEKYYTQKHGYQKWPGGKRGKVPELAA